MAQLTSTDRRVAVQQLAQHYSLRPRSILPVEQPVARQPTSHCQGSSLPILLPSSCLPRPDQRPKEQKSGKCGCSKVASRCSSAPAIGSLQPTAVVADTLRTNSVVPKSVAVRTLPASRPERKCESSSMDVSHPSRLLRSNWEANCDWLCWAANFKIRILRPSMARSTECEFPKQPATKITSRPLRDSSQTTTLLPCTTSTKAKATSSMIPQVMAVTVKLSALGGCQGLPSAQLL